MGAARRAYSHRSPTVFSQPAWLFGAITVGGIIVDPVNTAAGEIRGKSISGGVTKKPAAGDVVHIPAKMPHRLSVEPGKVCTYLVFKVRMQ